jgi:hypothetical protein
VGRVFKGTVRFDDKPISIRLVWDQRSFVDHCAFAVQFDLQASTYLYSGSVMEGLYFL